MRRTLSSSGAKTVGRLLSSEDTIMTQIDFVCSEGMHALALHPKGSTASRLALFLLVFGSRAIEHC